MDIDYDSDATSYESELDYSIDTPRNGDPNVGVYESDGEGCQMIVGQQNVLTPVKKPRTPKVWTYWSPMELSNLLQQFHSIYHIAV